MPQRAVLPPAEGVRAGRVAALLRDGLVLHRREHLLWEQHGGLCQRLLLGRLHVCE
jgi:hypothetical protein